MKKEDKISLTEELNNKSNLNDSVQESVISSESASKVNTFNSKKLILIIGGIIILLFVSALGVFGVSKFKNNLDGINKKTSSVNTKSVQVNDEESDIKEMGMPKKTVENVSNSKKQADENNIETSDYNKNEDRKNVDTTEVVANYCNLKNNIKFGDMVFKLVWSKEVVDGDYLLEYVPAGEDVEHYHNMLSIECVENEEITVDDALAIFVNNLEKEKQNDEFVHYKVYANDAVDTKIIDAILRDDDIIEWNIYRYQFLRQLTGTMGVIRFGFSKRAYGDERMEFMTKMPQIRESYIGTMAEVDMSQNFQ